MMENGKTAFVDIHTHVLPGVDDGAASLEVAIGMLRVASRSGTGVVVATPHMFHPAFPSLTPQEMRARFEAFRESLAQATRGASEFPGGLDVLLGAENFWGPAFLESLSRGDVLPMNDSRYLLVEFPPSVSGRELMRSSEILISEGWVPLLAHVERYEAVCRDPGLLRALRERGSLAQLNARSLEGRVWSKSRRMALRLLSEDLISVIASDSHGTTRRTPSLLAALQVLSQRFPPDRIAAWTAGNPAWVVGRVTP